MTTPGDYTQQLFAYLQAWRQLLESAAALAAAMPVPGMVPGLPPIPTPAAPPPFGAPSDPSQQLFAHLQAWRQYLEQTVGAAGTAPAHPPDSAAAAPAPPSSPRPTEPVPPDDANAGRSGAHSSSSSSASPPSGFAMQLRPPRNPFGGQITDDLTAAGVQRQAAVVARGNQIPRPPALEFGQRVASPAKRLDPGAAAAPAATVAALFKGLVERTPGVE